MLDLFERILLLKRSVMFAEVNTEDLSAVAQALVDEPHFKGERVFEKGERGEHMYVIQHGKIGISIDDDPKAQRFITVLGSGECFGEMNLLDEQERSATAHVLEDAHLLSLERAKLRGLIQRYPDLSLGMLKSLSLRLRNANLLTKDN